MRCPRCGTVAHRAKHRPRRLWRKVGYTRLWCDGCAWQWTVMDTGRASDDAQKPPAFGRRPPL